MHFEVLGKIEVGEEAGKHPDMSAVQLDLFSWEIVRIHDGYQALARLDFQEAGATFAVFCYEAAITRGSTL